MIEKERDLSVKSDVFFGLTAIIIFILILVITISNLNFFLRRNKEDLEIKANSHLHRLIDEENIILNPVCVIVTGNDKKDSIEIVEKSLEKDKIGYISKTKFEDITENELQKAEIVIINGSELSSLGNVDMLLEFLKQGKHIIFTSMPDVNYIKANMLEKIMGIKRISQSQSQKGIKFLPGFMLGGLLEFPELEYNTPRVELLSTTKTYVIGAEDSSIIWRNTYGKSEIYVVNGSFFETNAGYGILSAILAQVYPDYIYPIINAKVLTYTGFPYISYENTNTLEQVYSRNAMQLQHDILIPDILSINKSRNLIPTGFMTFDFNNNYSTEIDAFSIRQVNNYEKDIYELGGEVGIVYSGDFAKDENIYDKVFDNKKLKSILLYDEDFEVLNGLIDDRRLSSIESIIGPWTASKKSFEYLNESTVYIPFTIDGVANSDLEKLEFYSGITAFGAIIQNLSLDQIVFPQEDKDNWMNVSRDYIKFIDSYRVKFQMIEARNLIETSQLVKKFVINFPSIQYLENKIEIRFEEWYGESYYILRTNREIESITEGTIEKIEEGVYLVTVKNKQVDINLRQIDKYE